MKWPKDADMGQSFLDEFESKVKEWEEIKSEKYCSHSKLALIMTKLRKEMRDHILLNLTSFATYEKVREYARMVARNAARGLGARGRQAPEG